MPGVYAWPVANLFKRKQPSISILSDFGPDGAVWRMKTAIESVNPKARILDIDHTVPPFNVLCGAARLAEATGAIGVKEGSIFVAVVDPGVGTDRKGVVVRTRRGTLLLGPDNGLLSLVFQTEGVEQAVAIDEHGPLTFARQALSSTFHGQMVFAPVAAHLAKGAKITEFGDVLTEGDLKQIQIDGDAENSRLVGWSAGFLINIDPFGQLRTTIPNREILGQVGEKAHLWMQDGPVLRAQPGADSFREQLAHHSFPAPHSFDVLSISHLKEGEIRELELDRKPYYVQMNASQLEMYRSGSVLYSGTLLVDRVFEGAPSDIPLAVPSSTGCVDIAVNRGHAGRRLGVGFKHVALGADWRPLTRVRIEKK
ncbi:MAG: SAM-dependent chlorinase/fluorinase [Candidatus Micrarchaeota archaeon]